MYSIFYGVEIRDFTTNDEKKELYFHTMDKAKKFFEDVSNVYIKKEGVKEVYKDEYSCIAFYGNTKERVEIHVTQEHFAD